MQAGALDVHAQMPRNLLPTDRAFCLGLHERRSERLAATNMAARDERAGLRHPARTERATWLNNPFNKRPGGSRSNEAREAVRS
jgi:hypothetical protein